MPDSVDGNRVIVVAVDCFTKYVELAILPSKEATVIADWFEREILARYAMPA